MSLTLLTIIHTLISVAAIIAGIVVIADLLRGRDSGGWTHLFMATAFLTSATGFLFPFTVFLPSHGTAIVALLVLAVTLPARYRLRWPATYAVGAVASLFLLIFVAIAQVFAKVPSLRAVAPTQSEPPFLITESITLAIFVVIGVLAARNYRAAAPAAPLSERLSA